jgi:LacI family transcriptional regulator
LTKARYRPALLDYTIPFDKNLVYVCNNNSNYEDGYADTKKMIEIDKIEVNP